MIERDHLPAPLLGCLYCHAEGTITEVAVHPWFSFVQKYPKLVCSHCHSVMLFDENPTTNEWRIQFRRHNRNDKYYYAALHLGKGGWLSADEALKISTTAYVQRQRVQQAKQGNLSWLHPQQLALPPASISPREVVYLTFKHVTLHHQSPIKGGSEDILDSGAFYVTDEKLHLIGHDRDWVYELAKIRNVDFSKEAWRIHLDIKETPRYFECESQPDELDAQLVTLVLEAIRTNQLN